MAGVVVYSRLLVPYFLEFSNVLMPYLMVYLCQISNANSDHVRLI